MRKILLKSTMKVHKFAGKKERKKKRKKNPIIIYAIN